MTVIFLHHDIIAPEARRPSGFQGPGTEIYKVSVDQFREELRLLAHAFPRVQPDWRAGAPFALTFDDGGVSATEVVADILAERAWRAQFFIVTGFLGMPGFVSASGLRALKAAGHEIGTHTVTHPEQLHAKPYRRIRREWSDSRARLEDVLGAPVTSGSVPGGQCSRAVRAAAIEAGLETLMTSEPTTRGADCEPLTVRGRFAVRAQDCPRGPALLAQKVLRQRLKALRWRALNVAKGALGPVYPPLREGLLRLRAL